MAVQSCAGTALITAAASRAGRAIASRLAPEWNLVLHESPEFFAEVEALAQRLRGLGTRVATLAADLRDAAATGALVERAAEAAGAATLLVNSATHFAADPGGFSVVSWDDHFAINLRAPCQLADCFAAALPDGGCGAIVTLVDRRLWQNTAGARTYELSQAALWSATETMARAYAPRIRVNAVGLLKTLAIVPTGANQRGMPRDSHVAAEAIAKAVLYLATATAVTGQMIAIPAEEKAEQDLHRFDR